MFTQKELIRIFTVLLTFAFLYYVSGALLPFIIGIAMAYISLPFVSFLNKRLDLNISLVTALCILITYTSLGLLFSKAMPFLYGKLMSLTTTLKDLDIEKILHSIRSNAVENGASFSLLVKSFEALKGLVILKAPGYISYVFAAVLSSTQSFISIVFNLVFAPMISFYFLKDIYYREDLPKVIKYFNNLSKNFVQVLILMVVIYFICYSTVLTIISLEDAILLSIICACGYLLPYIGFLIGMCLCMIMTIVQYGIDYHAVLVSCSFVIVGVVDMVFISPRLIGPKFGLHPLMTISSFLVSTKLFGIVGMILAIPLAVIAKDIILFFHKQIYTDNPSL